MGRFVAVEDFLTGEFLISQQDQTDDLQAVIDRLEEEILQDLLGKEMYDLFIADLDTAPFPQVPQAARFTAIFEKFFQDDPFYLRSEGMIKMLQAMIWFEWTKGLGMENTPVGVIRNEFENSTNLSAVAANLEMDYNRGVRTFLSILDFIILDTTTYPEYSGRSKVRQFISFL